MKSSAHAMDLFRDSRILSRRDESRSNPKGAALCCQALIGHLPDLLFLDSKKALACGLMLSATSANSPVDGLSLVAPYIELGTLSSNKEAVTGR